MRGNPHGRFVQDLTSCPILDDLTNIVKNVRRRRLHPTLDDNVRFAHYIPFHRMGSACVPMSGIEPETTRARRVSSHRRVFTRSRTV